MDTTSIRSAGGIGTRVQSFVDVDVSHSFWTRQKAIIICNLDVQLEGSLE